MTGMSLAPFCPVRSGEDLDQTSGGRGKERSPQAEELGAGQEDEERDDGVDIHRRAEHPRRGDVGLEGARQNEVDQRQQGSGPALREGDDDADRADDPQTHHVRVVYQRIAPYTTHAATTAPVGHCRPTVLPDPRPLMWPYVASCGMEQPLAQQIQLHPPVGIALHPFELGDVPLHRPHLVLPREDIDAHRALRVSRPASNRRIRESVVLPGAFSADTTKQRARCPSLSICLRTRREAASRRC